MIIDSSGIGAPRPDDALVERFQAIGHEACFAELVRRHRKAIVDRCRRVMGGPGEVAVFFWPGCTRLRAAFA